MKNSTHYGIGALICAILSWFCFGIILSIAGIILGILSCTTKEEETKGCGIAGLVVIGVEWVYVLAVATLVVNL